MDKIHDFERENTISFSNRTELIQFVSKYLARKYKEHLEFWRATAMDDRKERLWWENRIEKEVTKFKANFERLLKWRLIFSKKAKITHKSLMLKIVLKMSKIKTSSENIFAVNVEYEINGLMFERIEKPYR